MIRCNGIEACRLVCNIRKSISSLDISKSAVFKSKGKVCCRYRCFWGLVHVSSSNKREGTNTGQRSVCLNTKAHRRDVSNIRSTDPGQAPGTGSDLWEYWRITVEFTKQIILQSMWEKQCQANKQCGPDVALKVNPHPHCLCLNMLWYSLSSLSQSCCSSSCWSQLSGVFELQQEIPGPVDSRTGFDLMYSSNLFSSFIYSCNYSILVNFNYQRSFKPLVKKVNRPLLNGDFKLG